VTTDNHNALKRSYQETIKVVTEVINDWDPYDLIKSGAPDNEFSPEVGRIAAKAHGVKTSMELAKIISGVFTDQFGPEYFSVEACVQVASRLFTDLKNHGLLESRES